MKLAVSIIAVFTAGFAFANDLPPIPLDKQTNEADSIIIGRTGSEVPCRVHGEQANCVQLHIEAVLKGDGENIGRRYYLRRSFGDGEDYVWSALILGRALMFLRRVDVEVYVPLHGDRSILSIF